MQHERHRFQPIEGRFDRIQVFRAFGQHQYLASLPDGTTHLGGDGFRSNLVIDEMPKLDLRPSCPGRW